MADLERLQQLRRQRAVIAEHLAGWINKSLNHHPFPATRPVSHPYRHAPSALEASARPFSPAAGPALTTPPEAILEQ
ncbi:MAG: hypothetical protein J6386_19365 [Candidatus Synoicihabitans palmerolidicus]|nr:hypothetical protein [Candidatus Synoicihabitans palmerolidicus]